jgi:hypothetical protein
MADAILTQPVTARAFLLGEDQDSPLSLARALEDQGVGGILGGALQDLSHAGQTAISDEVASTAQHLLDLDLGDLLVAGWRKHAGLRAAAKRTAATSGSSQEVVLLPTHRVTSTHSPSVELVVDNVRVATLHFELGFEFVVQGLAATISDGRLVAFRCESCEVTATLAAEGRQLVTRRAQIQLPLVVRRGEGIQLLP